ncbi:acyl-CoA thioesterase [Luteibacter pinisoli]|nr:acyl-CoA thioesterase [Luteibacter pinisoli]
MPKSPAMLPIARPTEARVLEIVFPDHTNHLGTLFGGQALAWMDKAAFLAASRYSRKIVVTARSEQVDFHVPVRKGQMVELVATVVSVGRTSMNIDVAMFTEELITGERELCTRGTFVMIALDENHKPTLVESLAADDRA